MAGKCSRKKKIGTSVSRDAYRPGIPSPLIESNISPYVSIAVLGCADVKKTRDALGQKAVAALDEAVAEVVKTHMQAKRKLAVWRDGKAVLISPAEAMIVREERTPYGKSK